MTVDGEAGKKRSEEIDKRLAADRLSRKDEIKLLLLGEFDKSKASWLAC